MSAEVIANWSYGLLRDTGKILLGMNPDEHMTKVLRDTLEQDGDRLLDLHLWRLGPGHLGAVVSVATAAHRDASFYRNQLDQFASLSHITVEVREVAAL